MFQVLGSQKQEECRIEKTVTEVPLTEAVKRKQPEEEQQRRQEAVVQKDRVRTSSVGFFFPSAVLQNHYKNNLAKIMHTYLAN